MFRLCRRPTQKGSHCRKCFSSAIRFDEWVWHWELRLLYHYSNTVHIYSTAERIETHLRNYRGLKERSRRSLNLCFRRILNIRTSSFGAQHSVYYANYHGTESFSSLCIRALPNVSHIAIPTSGGTPSSACSAWPKRVETSALTPLMSLVWPWYHQII